MNGDNLNRNRGDSDADKSQAHRAPQVNGTHQDPGREVGPGEEPGEYEVRPPSPGTRRRLQEERELDQDSDNGDPLTNGDSAAARAPANYGAPSRQQRAASTTAQVNGHTVNGHTSNGDTTTDNDDFPCRHVFPGRDNNALTLAPTCDECGQAQPIPLRKCMLCAKVLCQTCSNVRT